jgi:antitoxin VapB
MALNIKSDYTDRLARELSAETGESITTAVTVALQERLQRVKRPRDTARRAALEKFFAGLPKFEPIDERWPDEILGYDEDGVWR